MSPACRIRIRVADTPAGAAGALAAALGPDNVGMPDGMEIAIKSADALEVTISGPEIPPLISAADEILEHVQAGLGAIGDD